MRTLTCMLSLALAWPGDAASSDVPPAPANPVFEPVESIALAPRVRTGGCGHARDEHPEWSVTPLPGGRWKVAFSDPHGSTERLAPDGIRAWMQGTELRIRYELEPTDPDPDPYKPILACGGATDVELEVELPREPETLSIYRSTREATLRWALVGTRTRPDGAPASLSWQQPGAGDAWWWRGPEVHDGLECRFFRQDRIGANSVLVTVEGPTCRQARYTLTIASAEGETLFRSVEPLANLYFSGDDPYAETMEARALEAAQATIAQSVVGAARSEGFSDEAGHDCQFSDDVPGAREAIAAATQWVVLPVSPWSEVYVVADPRGGKFVQAAYCASP
jgi:hypothetical protein